MVTEITEKKQPADYTEGSILRSILVMGLPSMFGFVTQHVYILADKAWIGLLEDGDTAIAALTFFNQIMWGVFAFNQLVGPGSVAIISRRYGEKDYPLTAAAIRDTILLKAAFGTLLAAAIWLALPSMLHFLNAEPDAFTIAVDYGRVMLIGLPVMFTMYSLFTAMRGVANPVLSMCLMIGANVLNIVLDPLLIFGIGTFEGFGVLGAAYASVASATITLLTGLFLFGTNAVNVRLKASAFLTVSLERMWRIVRVGVPSFISEILFSSSRILLLKVLAGFGSGVVAAYGISNDLFAFGIMLLVGLGLGLSSLIGHNVGAGKKERARKVGDSSILLGAAVMTASGILTFIFAEAYLGFFLDDPETIAIGVQLLRIWALAFPFVGVFITLEQIHMGVGLNTPTMVIVAIHAWVFQYVPAIILVRGFGFDESAVWWTLSLSVLVSSTIFYFYYRRGRWLETTV